MVFTMATDIITYICGYLFRRMLVEETYRAETSISSILNSRSLFHELLYCFAWRVMVGEPADFSFDRVDEALSTT
jgi:hypothetical protein